MIQPSETRATHTRSKGVKDSPVTSPEENKLIQEKEDEIIKLKRELEVVRASQKRKLGHVSTEDLKQLKKNLVTELAAVTARTKKKTQKELDREAKQVASHVTANLSQAVRDNVEAVLRNPDIKQEKKKSKPAESKTLHQPDQTRSKMGIDDNYFQNYRTDIKYMFDKHIEDKEKSETRKETILTHFFDNQKEVELLRIRSQRKRARCSDGDSSSSSSSSSSSDDDEHASNKKKKKKRQKKKKNKKGHRKKQKNR